MAAAYAKLLWYRVSLGAVTRARDDIFGVFVSFPLAATCCDSWRIPSYTSRLSTKMSQTKNPGVSTLHVPNILPVRGDAIAK